MQTEEKVRKIKRSFRLYMNGEAARSMREKGLAYKLIWGVSLNHLKLMAAEYGHDYDLAMALWKENIRECKILAMLIMPPDAMTKSLAEAWAADIPTVEAAELCVFTLFRHLPFAGELAEGWLVSDRNLMRICAYHTMCSLLTPGSCPSENMVNRILESARRDLATGDISLRHSAGNCLMRLMAVGEEYEKLGESLLESLS